MKVNQVEVKTVSVRCTEVSVQLLSHVCMRWKKTHRVKT